MGLYRKKQERQACCANRQGWLAQMDVLATPVLNAAARQELHLVFPEPESRLAAAAGVLCGLSSYLEAKPVPAEIDGYRRLYSGALALLDAVTDPASPDACYLPCRQGAPTEMAQANGLLAFALLKARRVLLHAPAPGKARLLAYFKNAKRCRPRLGREELLYGAMVELALYEVSGTCETQNLNAVMTTLMKHYRGDGVFAPEHQYQWGYLHSFYVYPMLDMIAGYLPRWFDSQAKEWGETVRMAFLRMLTIQMRFLAADGSFPPIGPDLWLRSGAFHTLAHGAYREQLPKGLTYPCVQSAMYQMIKRTLTPGGTVDENGFLLPGLCGHQPDLCGPGFLRGRLYGCMAVFAPLGLPVCHSFWMPYTAALPWQKVWTGQDIRLDSCH